MKKSELKEIIKAEFLSEDEDSKKGNENEQKRMEGAIRDDRDHIKNLEKDVKDNEDKLSKLKKDETEDVSEAVEDDVDVDVEDDINIDVEDDIDIDDVSDKSEIEVDSELAGEDADVSAILGLLTKAQEEAKNLGDEKLMDQIGNTITYYTRAHVVAEDERTDAEEEGYRDGMEDEKEDLNEEVARFKKLAGLIK